jgi:cell division protein FtsL
MDEPVVVVRHPIGPPPLALRLAAVLAVPLLLYVLVMTGQKAVENYQLNRQSDDLRAQIQGLRAQNVELQQDIQQARTDSAIEALARERLGLIKPGDHPLVLISDGSTPGVPPAQAQPVPAPEPTWRQWWNYLFG